MLLRNILVPLDGSPLSERALPYAAELARAAGASLTLVRAADVHPRSSADKPLFGTRRSRPNFCDRCGPGARPPSPRSLNIHAYPLRAQGVVVHTAVAPGDPPGALVTEIGRRQPDLVVMSTHGRSGINRLVHGSVTDTVVSRVGCPVMLVRARRASGASPAPRLAGKHVVVPLDGTRFSESALPLAVNLARTLGSPLLLVQAIAPMYQVYSVPIDLGPAVPSELAQAQWLADVEAAATGYANALAMRLSLSEHGLRVTGVARVGQLTEVIRELSSPAPGQLDAPIGLVVISTHGRTSLSRAILGSEADGVVYGDDVPVVLVHPHAADPMQEVDQTPAMFARGAHANA